MLNLLIATRNAGKISEIAELLADLPVNLKSLNDFSNIIEPEETGATFAENAELKARSYALQTGFTALADDSGLEVAALGGAPGVFSARYAGARATDAERIFKLLNKLSNAENRSAQFVCAMAIAGESGEIKFTGEGVCKGVLSTKARGENGFGYDPIFVPEGFSETFGELSGSIKREISHRARAMNKIIAYLRAFYAV